MDELQNNDAARKNSGQKLHKSVWFHLYKMLDHTTYSMVKIQGRWEEKVTKSGENFWEWWICLLSWLGWWFHSCILMSKLIKSYTLNMWVRLFPKNVWWGTRCLHNSKYFRQTLYKLKRKRRNFALGKPGRRHLSGVVTVAVRSGALKSQPLNLRALLTGSCLSTRVMRVQGGLRGCARWRRGKKLTMKAALDSEQDPFA